MWARKTYGEENATATMNASDIQAAVQDIDDAMEDVPTNLPSQGSSIAVNLNQSLPEPFATEATTAGKGLLVGLWASVKYGAI